MAMFALMNVVLVQEFSREGIQLAPSCCRTNKNHVF